MKSIINIGVSTNKEDALNRKIRISNLISAITVIYMTVFLPTAFIYQYYIIAVLNLLFLCISALNFFFHYKKEHKLAFYVYCIFGSFYFSAAVVIYGLQSQMHFFLLIMCMISIVLFDNLLALKTYNFIVSVVFLALVIYMRNREGLIAFTEEMKKAQAVVEIIIIFSLFLITIVFFLFFKRDNIVFQKIILEQRKLVQEKQKDVMDSITYSKRIQEALLPSEPYWFKNLPESFIFYKPKDIVAGDFYWMENDPYGKTIFFAVGDCTGHGVPGAMVSVVCHNALNRSLFEFKLTDPGKILDKTRELVIETFGKSEEELKDGMDISLCALNPETNELLWSGANNSLWYITKSEEPDSIKEIKADKQPVGNYSAQKPFTTHKLQLHKGDSLYLFTDGYADQFGGPKGKKFRYKQLQQTVLSLQNTPISLQKQSLEKLFDEWKNNLEQIDDVCIIGVRI